jgi:hypothetical protein
MGTGVKRPRLQSDLSTAITAQVMNEWSYNSTIPYIKLSISFKMQLLIAVHVTCNYIGKSKSYLHDKSFL